MNIGMKVGVEVGIGSRLDAAGATAATLSTTALSALVLTSGARWAATLTWEQAGATGNGGVLSLSFLDGDPATVEVRDGEVHDGNAWAAAPSTVGCLVVFAAGIDEITVGEIEAAINAGSSLALVTTHDPTPAKTVAAEMDAVVTAGSFSGGVG